MVGPDADPEAGIHVTKHGACQVMYHVCPAVLQIPGVGFGSQSEIKHVTPPISGLNGVSVHFSQGEKERRTTAYQFIPSQARHFFS
jgi:hypothetical protein